MTALWKVALDGDVRLAVGPPDTGPVGLLPTGLSIDTLLSGAQAFSEYNLLATEPLTEAARTVLPLEGQEVWAAGVTFVESRFAREQEANRPDVYRDVYFAERPELFFKAAPGTAAGPSDPIAIRADSDWNVPEPELALIVDAHGEIVALTIGNDVSSRSIEGENPLYLPQAKVYDGSCAIGPCLVPVGDVGPLTELVIGITIRRGGSAVFQGQASLSQLKRTPKELVRWLYMARAFPRGSVLLTGTAIVPPPDFSLGEGDVVSIEIPGLGSLVNPTRTVGKLEADPG